MANPKAHQLIILDLLMPKINGFEFVRKAKKIDSTVKVFLMTCFDTDDLELYTSAAVICVCCISRKNDL